jgi:hypothetical protein
MNGTTNKTEDNNNQKGKEGKRREGSRGADISNPIIHAEVCPDIPELTLETQKLG